ncbi:MULTISPECIES: hypothetical protein [unclassified Acidovorax]|jgi:hypothetical protein|uniref:hypothetical protein n=1 Tax=unclassified Acidovorax TaxID=2684926 RepID=UPI001C48EE30|nr:MULTISPECIES: hypothetical protein [unclassified Acidovorax]MBV7461765.1 hypothetical protein [Acidovorax sp. sif0632]MBV7466861.1 hypothetical protein [Acidovorax sp. sif0613]
MNTFSRFLSVAVAATLTSVGAQASELDPAQFATQFEGNRTRAEVAVEAAQVPMTRSQIPSGSKAESYKSVADRAAIRAQAADAVRTGQISSGETGAR